MFGIPSPYMIVGGALLAVAIVGGAYVKGSVAGRQGCELRVERAVVAEQARQAQIAQEALDAIQTQLDASEAENVAKAAKVAEYEAQLAAKPEAACTLDDTNAEKINGAR